jgi:hypothetical protein
MKWKMLKEGSFQALITTGQFFGEGTDIQNIDRLFLVYPFSFQGKLIQYIGRVQRSEIAPVIYDYRDIRIDYLNKLFLKRNTYYRKLEKQASLFDEPEPDFLPAGNTLSIEETIIIAIDDLEFRYGSIAFSYYADKINQELEIEIENDQIRPEFDVLKPYFSKILKKQRVNVHIQAEFQEKTLISQLATSSDLEKINGEIIDIARFRFVSKFILGGSYNKFKGSLMDINQLQSQEDSKIVLNPFSFVFLLAGQEQFHLVMETLDTREATYIWHIEKDKQELRNQLQVIDRQLNIIRNDGRQAFLESQPVNFSRVLHDYSDEQKGFVLWKGLVEERLT